MHKIDTFGATGSNEFTEGSVSLTIPATVVGEDWLNAVQKEIVTIVEAAGLTLKTSGTETGDQLLAAVQGLITGGGAAAPITQAINNNQASAADVTDFPLFLSTEILGIEFLYRVLRRTDSSYYTDMGRGYLFYDSELDSWEVARRMEFDDAATEFVVTPTANPDEYKLQYTSDNLAGSSYVGNLQITDIKRIYA